MTTVETVSAALIEAHASGRNADARRLPVPGYDEALEIQQRVQPHLGPVGGFKVARQADGPPILAPIPAARRLPSGARIPVRDRMGIELEIGFEVIAPPSGDVMQDPASVFRPRVVLELVETRLDGAEDSPMLKLADMQVNAGLVVGPELTNWDGSDFGQVTAALRCGDRQVVDGAVSVPGGSALANLALLRDHAGDHCGGLQQGQIVITGSLSGLEFFPGGTHVAGRIEGIGAISCDLD